MMEWDLLEPDFQNHGSLEPEYGVSDPVIGPFN